MTNVFHSYQWPNRCSYYELLIAPCYILDCWCVSRWITSWLPTTDFSRNNRHFWTRIRWIFVIVAPLNSKLRKTSLIQKFPEKMHFCAYHEKSKFSTFCRLHSSTDIAVVTEHFRLATSDSTTQEKQTLCNFAMFPTIQSDHKHLNPTSCPSYLLWINQCMVRNVHCEPKE